MRARKPGLAPVAVILALMLGCTAVQDQPAASRLDQERADAFQRFDRAACAARGGVVRSVCMLGFPACVVNYPDAGKACSDQADCKGGCGVAGEFVKPGTAVTGQCAASSEPCGCRQLVLAGRAQAALCED